MDNTPFCLEDSTRLGPYQAAGSFSADGSGLLSNGIEDINCGLGAADPICASGPVAGQTFAGSYAINADGRGTFTIAPTGGGQSQTFAVVVSSSNAKARFIESDSATSSIRGSGVLESQTPSAFTSSAFTGGYAFSLSGVDASGEPLAAIGGMALFTDSITNLPVIRSGALDVNDNGTLSCYPPVTGTPACLSAGTPNKFTGSFAVPVPSSNGRGTATFSVPGFAGNTFSFSLYVISATEFFLLSMDDPAITNNPVFSGQVLKQQLPSSPGLPFQKGQAVFSWGGWSRVTSGSARDYPGGCGATGAGWLRWHYWL